MKIFILLFMLIPVLSWAHPEPGFGIVNAEESAKMYIEKLIDQKELPETWSSAYTDLDRSGLQIINGKKRWIIVYENNDEKDKSKKLIKIIMTPLGKFVAYEFISTFKK